MAFPSFISSIDSGGSSSTTHNVSITAVTAGEMQILHYFKSNQSTVSTPSGWTKLTERDISTTYKSVVFWRIAPSTASQTTVSITSGTASSYSAVCQRISGANRLESTSTSSSGTNANPASLTPTAGSQDYMWITSNVCEDDAITLPTGYTSGGARTTPNPFCVHTGYKTSTAASEDPGAWTTQYSSTYATWTIGVYADYPTVSATATTTGAASTSHVITMPTHSAGQLLVVVGGVAGSSQVATATAGWNRAERDELTVWWKKAASASEALTITTTNSIRVYRAFAITGANDLEVVGGTGATDSPSLTLDTARDALWLTAHLNYGGSATAATAAPANYGNLQTVTYSTNYHVSTAYRQATLTTEDPGAFTIGTTANQRAVTIALFNRTGDVVRRKFRFVNYASGGDSPIVGGDRLFTTDGWSTSRSNTSNTMAYIVAASSTVDGMGGALDLQVLSSRTETGYFKWTGTFQELGVPSGATVTGYQTCKVDWSVVARNSGTFTLGDADGGKGALEVIDSSSRVLIPSQSSVSTTTSWATASNNPNITGLSLASSSSLELRLHVDVTSTTNIEVYLDNVELLVTYSTSAPETIAVDTASFTVTTQDATIATPTSIAADTQSVAVTTQDANINEITNVEVDAATFAVTTEDVTINAREAVDVDTAQANFYLLQAEINASELLTVDTDSVAVTTQDPNIAENDTVAVDTDAIAITTFDVNVAADGTELVDTLAISVTTEAATVLAAEAIVIDSSTITITTHDAQLNEGNQIVVDLADFVANTYPANINEVYSVVTETAEVSVTTYPMVIEADEFIAINTAAIDVVMYEAWLPVYWKDIVTEATVYKWVANENGAAVKTAVTISGSSQYKKYGEWIKPQISGEWIKN